MARQSRSPVDDGQNLVRLPFLREREQKEREEERVGREYDRVLLSSMAKARFRRYVLMDEWVSMHQPLVA